MVTGIMICNKIGNLICLRRLFTLRVASNLKFKHNQTIISFISTITLAQLKKTINTKMIMKYY